MSYYHIGDKLPAKKKMGKSYTIVFPEYEDYRFAIIKNQKLWKLTDSSREIIEPFIDKWGKDVKVRKRFNPSKRNNLDVIGDVIEIKDGETWIVLGNLD